MSFFKKPKSFESNGNVDLAEAPVLDTNQQLKKIADHLVFLEKKIDTLIEQSKNRPSFNRGFGNRPGQFQRPGGNFRGNSYGNQGSQGQRPHGHHPRKSFQRPHSAHSASHQG